MTIIPWILALLLQGGTIIFLFRFLKKSGKKGQWYLLLTIPVILVLLFIYGLVNSQSLELTNPVISLSVLVVSIIELFLSSALPPQVTKALNDFDAVQSEVDYHQLIFEHLPQPVVVKDNRSVYSRVTPAYSNLLGKSVDILIGRTDADFYPHKVSQQLQENEKKALEGGFPVVDEIEVPTTKGNRLFSYHFVPLINKLGVKQGLLVSGYDITEPSNEISFLKSLLQGNELIDEALHQVALSLDRNQILETGGAQLQKLAKGYHILMGEINPDMSLMTIVIGTGAFSGLVGEQIRPGNGLLGKVWQGGKIITIDDYQNWSAKGNSDFEKQIQTAVGVPLNLDSSMWGALGLFAEDKDKKFTTEEIELFRKLGNTIGFALQNQRRIQLYETSIQKSRREIEVLAQRQRLEHFLAALSTRLINVPPAAIDDLLQRAIQTIAEYLELHRSYICLFRKDEADVELAYQWSRDGFAQSPETIVNIDSGGYSWLVDKLYRQESVYAEKAQLENEPSELREYLKAKNIEMLVAIPLVSRRMVTGYLGLESSGGTPSLSAEHLQVLKICADMVINALERKWAAEELEGRLKQTKEKINRLELTNQRSKLIADMGELLQSCRTADEAYPIIGRYAQQLIPSCSGALYLVRNIPNTADKVANWGDAVGVTGENELNMSECWGIRRGKLHAVTDPEEGPLCGHLGSPLPSAYLCVPLIAQGDTVGLLHFRENESTQTDSGMMSEQSELALALAEHIAPALSNLSLRDRLRSQAIRDPLTGLFNRRYMEETLEREIRRAARHKSSVGVIMCDIDQMKPINDRYGHDAGDVLLRAVGGLMVKMFRGEDVACRYGGDEFTVILPEASLSDVWQRAEHLRDAIKKTSIEYEGNKIGPITMSIGVAAYPDLGMTSERLLQICDAAIYLAKDEGGDRVMIGRRSEEVEK